MGVRKVIFPCDLPHWNIVSQQLLQLQFYCQSSGATPQGLAQLHHQIFLQIRSKGPPTPFSYHESTSGSQPKELSTAESQPCVYQGLVIFLEQVASIDEKDCFLHFIFPAVIDMACNIKELLPQEGIPLCRKQCTKSIAVSRNLMSAIISCAFLCLFPERKKEKTSRLNNINFSNFFRHLPLQSQCAKLRCILHYFRRVASTGQYLTGEIEIQRQVMEPRKRPTLETWKNCSTNLCSIYVRENGKTYDASSATLKIGFANRFLGGHILTKGRCQEEIIYMTCPELLASTLFMEAMDDNEAITVKGFEKFSEFSGYGENLKFSGNYCDKASRKSDGNLETMLSAINTLPYKFNNQQRQYMDRYLLRDLNKCLVGFQPAVSSLNYTSIGEASFFNQVFVSSQTQTITTEITEDTIPLTNVDSSSMIPLHKNNVASNTDQILNTNEATDVEGERKEVKFVEDIDSFAKRLTKEIITESLYELNPQCTCNSSDDIAPRFDKEFKSIAKFIPEHCSLYGSGLLTSSFSHAASMDYLDVDYHDWISNFRRRSSNLSDLTSRRSSCSTRYSSDISSDFEELYESFMKRELTTRPGTIHEEIGMYNVQDFAANFIENLLQESAAIVYNATGMQNFQNIQLPSNLHKPVPIKFGPEPNIDRNANISFISEDTVQCYVDHLFEDIKVTIVDSEEFCLQCENNKEQQKQCSFFCNLSTLKDLSDASIMSVDPTCNIFWPTIPDAIYSYSDYLSNEILCDSLNEISSLNISALVSSILSSNKEYKVSPSTTELDLTAVADKLVNQIFQEAKAIVNCNNPSSDSSSRRQSLLSNSSSMSGWMSNNLSFGCWINDLSTNILDNSLKTAHKINMFIDSIECHGVKAAYTSSSSQGVYLPDYDKYALTITKELFTNALLELHENYLINPYYRQLLRYQYVPNLPNMTSVEDTDCCGVSVDHKLVPQEDLANFYLELERQSSLSEQNKTIKRSMSGFRDITLSQFAEELMRTDATSQSLMNLRNNWHQESFHSGSLSGFKDNTLASFEDELLRSRVDSPDSLLYFDIRENFQHQESVISRTDISDDPTSKDFSEIHSMSLDSDDNLSTFADQVSEEIMYESFVDIFGIIPCNVQFKSNMCLQCLEMIADKIATNVIHVAILTLQNPSCDYSEDLTLNLPQLSNSCLHRKFPVMTVIDSKPQNIPPPQTLHDFYENASKDIIESAILTVSSCRDIYQSNCRALVSSCGIPGSNPQLEVLLQWIVASYIKTPVFICYTKQSEKLVRFPDVVSIVQAKCWTVGDLMCTVHKFCNQALEQLDTEGIITLDLFEEVIISAHHCRPILEMSPDEATVIVEVSSTNSTVVNLPVESVTSSNNNGDVVLAVSEDFQIPPATLLTSESNTVIDNEPD